MKLLILSLMLIVGLDLSWWWLAPVVLVELWNATRSVARDQRSANQTVTPNEPSGAQ